MDELKTCLEKAGLDINSVDKLNLDVDDKREDSVTMKHYLCLKQYRSCEGGDDDK